MASILKEPSLELKLLLEECNTLLSIGSGLGVAVEVESVGGGVGSDEVLDVAKDSHKEKDTHKETHKEKDKDKERERERERDALRELEEGKIYPSRTVPFIESQYSTVQHDTVQYNSIQYNTIQYTTTQ